MHNMHAKTITKYTLIALIPIALILGNFRLLVFNNEFYYDEIDKNNINIENAREHTAGIISYLRTGETPKNKLISKDELTHLGDVRHLIQITLTIFYVLLALAACALMFLIYKHRILALKSIYYGGISTAATVVIALLILTVAFDQAFFIFHKILFRNDLWLLPAESTLIRLFPQEFFIDFAKKLGLNTVLMSLLLIMIGRLKR